jgi:hypothetical protein
MVRMPVRGRRRLRRLRWTAALVLILTASSAAPARAVPTSAYGGQAQQALEVGGSPAGAYGIPAAPVPGTGTDGGGLPFSAFDLLLIIGGSGLILLSGAGFGRLLAERQRIRHP